MIIMLRVMGVLGVLLFGALFTVTFLSPATVEEVALEFVKDRVEVEVREKLQSVAESTLTGRALKIAGDLGVESATLTETLAIDLPEKIADVIDEMCRSGCEEQKVFAQTAALELLDRIQAVRLTEDTVGDLVKRKYMEIVGGLKVDLRVFLGSNLALFAILLGVSFLKRRAAAHLCIPGLLLLVATLISSAIYVFGQDWFFTILYNDYMGLGYLVYVLVIFAFLVDIAMNKARVTAEIINSVLEWLGSAISVSPC